MRPAPRTVGSAARAITLSMVILGLTGGALPPAAVAEPRSTSLLVYLLIGKVRLPKSAPTPERARPGRTNYQTKMEIQNLDEAAANVTVTYYQDRKSGRGAPTEPFTIPGGEATTFIPGDFFKNNSSGAAIVSSDVPIAAVVQSQWRDGGQPFASTLPVAPLPPAGPFVQLVTTGGDATVICPQNLANSSTQVAVKYFDANGQEQDGDTARLKPMGIRCVRGPSGFSGSVTIDAGSGDIVAVANTFDAGLAASRSYGGFDPAPNTDVYLPAVHRNHGGFTSTFFVQNVSPAPVDLEIRYTPISGNSVTQRHDFVQGNQGIQVDLGQVPGLTDGFLGAATIQVVGGTGTPVAVVNTVNGAGVGTSYNGFTTGTGRGESRTVAIPLVKGLFDTTTAVHIQNVGSGTAKGTIECTFGNRGLARRYKVPRGGVDAIDLLPAFLGFGSCTVTGTKGVVAAVVIEQGPGTLHAYQGFNQ